MENIVKGGQIFYLKFISIFEEVNYVNFRSQQRRL